MRTDLLKPQRTQKWDGIGFTPPYITALTLIGPLWDLIKKSMASLMATALVVFLRFLKGWLPNDQRQPHLGRVEDGKMFRPVARGHYAPAVSGKHCTTTAVCRQPAWGSLSIYLSRFHLYHWCFCPPNAGL